MAVPVELRYTAQHEWVLITGKVARIGITDYAQDALGDVVYVQVPTVGASVAAELILTGKFINAERALRLGLADSPLE